jgi:hypothetical protein
MNEIAKPVRRLSSKSISSDYERYMNKGNVNTSDYANLFGLSSGLVDIMNEPTNSGEQSVPFSALSGALKGAGMGAALGPVGMLAGAAIGGITSGISQGKENKEIRAQQEQQKNLEIARKAKIDLENSKAILTTFPSYGVETYSLYAKNGGKIPSYRLSSGGVMPLAGAKEFVGPSHQQGGIDVYAGSGQKLAEVEGGEVEFSDQYGTKKVLSKQLGFADIAKEYMQTEAYKVKLAEFEEGKLKNEATMGKVRDRFAKGTFERNQMKLVHPLSPIYEQQEGFKKANNITNETPTMNFGGELQNKSVLGLLIDKIKGNEELMTATGMPDLASSLYNKMFAMGGAYRMPNGGTYPMLQSQYPAANPFNILSPYDYFLGPPGKTEMYQKADVTTGELVTPSLPLSGVPVNLAPSKFQQELNPQVTPNPAADLKSFPIRYVPTATTPSVGKIDYKSTFEPKQEEPSTDNTGKNINAMYDIAGSVLPFVDNIVNARNIKKTPEVPVPEPFKAVPLITDLNYSPAYANIDRSLQTGLRGVGQYGSGLGNILSNRSKLFTDALVAKGNIAAEEINREVQLKNQSRLNSQGVGMQNTAQTNNYNTMVMQRKAEIISKMSENMAEAVEDALLLVRERNMKEYDKKRFELIKKKYKQTGVLDRADIDSLFGIYDNSTSNSDKKSE